MARTKKQLDNLKPIRKGDLSEEELKKRQRNGGKKSAEVRREKRDARQAARYILGLAAKGQISENLKNLGLPDGDRTNMEALQARLFTMAMSGNLDAYKELMRTAGYDPEENRRERESVSSDRRRDIEVEAKLKTLGQNIDGSTIAINQADEDGRSDVVIYMPQMMTEEECQVEDSTDGGGTDGEG